MSDSLVVGAIIFRCKGCQAFDVDRRGIGLERCAPCRKIKRARALDMMRLDRALRPFGTYNRWEVS